MDTQDNLCKADNLRKENKPKSTDWFFGTGNTLLTSKIDTSLLGTMDKRQLKAPKQL